MRSGRPELVVFDFAGTTFLDDGAVVSAFRTALDRHAIPATDAEILARRGASKSAVFHELAGRVASDAAERVALGAAALGTFEQALDAAYAGGPLAEVPGAGQAVATLRAAGLQVALTTGFARALAQRLLQRLGWDAAFDAVVCGDEVSAGRPAPYLIFESMIRCGAQDVRRVAVVGDTPLDLASAANAGAGWAIGVLTGAHGLRTLGRAPHTHLLASVAEVPELFGIANG